MATTTGTATDYLDLLTDLITFCTGTLGWVQEQDISDSPFTQREVILRAPGDSSPEANIYVGIRTQFNAGAGRYNWQLRGFTGYDSGSPAGSVLFNDQAGLSPPCYVPLRNVSMNYQFWGNGRHVKGIVVTGTSYQFFYLGFLNLLTATETDYPYPLLVMGSTHVSTQLFSDNDIDYSTATRPAGNSTTTLPSPGEVNPSNSAGAWLRWVDGQWYPVKNFFASGSSEASLSGNTVQAWPLCEEAGADSDTLVEAVEPAPHSHPYRLFNADTAGGSRNADLLPCYGSPEQPPLFPVTLVKWQPTKDFIGEIDGVFWVHASVLSLAAEDTIRDLGVSPIEEYIVYPNVHRTDPWTFFAVRNV
jgi:hypothetical protein